MFLSSDPFSASANILSTIFFKKQNKTITQMFVDNDDDDDECAPPPSLPALLSTSFRTCSLGQGAAAAADAFPLH